MGATTRIDHVEGGITFDEASVDNSGVITLSGWSQKKTDEFTQPILAIEGEERAPDHFWRVHRPDIPDIPMAGFGFQWVLDKPISLPSPPAGFFRRTPKSDVTIRIKGKQFAIYGPAHFRTPDYSSLFDTEQVLKREHIYGFGPPNDHVPTEVERLLPLITGKVLDFGCGIGMLIRALRGRGQDATGIEIIRPGIVDAIPDDVRPHIVLYEGGNLPYTDDQFETATAFEVLEHVEDYEKALSELSRVARRLVISVPDMVTIPLLSQHGVVPWHLLESTHVNFFTERSLRAALKRHYSRIEFGRISPRAINGTKFHLSLLAIAER